MNKILFILAALLISFPVAAANIHIVDGDTIEMDGEKIRLAGIDTPESDQVCEERHEGEWPCGWAATDFLQRFIAGKEVTCKRIAKDKYKRTLATCYADGENINMALVASGMAIPYHIGGKEYKAAAESAKKKRIGLWYGGFTEPAKWRKSKRKKR